MLRIIPLLIILNICPSVSFSSQFKMQVISPMIRVFRDVEYFGSSEKIMLEAAGNEFESAQIAFFAKDKISLDKVVVTELKIAGSKNSISEKNCTVRVPEYVYVEWNTRATPKAELDRRAPDRFPDPLPDFSPLNFSGSRSVYITCYIPANQPSGVYQGTVHITINDELNSLPIEIKVWEFSLPAKPTLFTSNWLHTSQLVKQYGIRSNSAEYWELINLVAEDMKQHRQNVIFTRLNIVKAIQLPNGGYKFDFSDYEKWVNIFLNHGFQAIEGAPLFHPKAYQIISATNGKKIKFDKKSLSKFLYSVNGQKFIRLFLQALHQKNKQLGVEKMYLQHVGDEADPKEIKLYRELVKIVHKEMPGVPIIDATHLDDKQRKGMMDIAVTNMQANESKQDDGKWKSWGRWWYTAGFKPRGKMPNRFIDYPLVKMRMLSWLSWRYDMSGYLHYGYNWWQMPSRKSPWIQTQYKNYSAGDGWIVYPPKKPEIHAPVASLRWEVFRDGLEDYEYFNLLKQWVTRLDLVMHNGKQNVNKQVFLDKGKSLLALLRSEIKNKNEYPKNLAQVKSFRRGVGTWLAEVNSYFKGVYP